jgi:hypothetical protein
MGAILHPELATLAAQDRHPRRRDAHAFGQQATQRAVRAAI